MGVLDGSGVLQVPLLPTVTTPSPSPSTVSTTSTTGTSSSNAASSVAATQSSGASETPAPSHTGRTVGLAVGISLGVCAIAGLLGVWFLFRRRLRKERTRREELEATIAQKPKMSSEEKELKLAPPAQEIDSSRREELDNEHAKYEVGSNSYRHEM